MNQLTPDAFERAKRYLIRWARPLERALHAALFEQASALDALDALDTYRGSDGGYGRGLEPDLPGRGSTALASAVALRRLRQLGAGPRDPRVRGVVDYLQRSLDPVTQVWRIVPGRAGDEPGAPWWLADGLEPRFGCFRVNPRADLLAHLWRLHLADPSALLDRAWLHALLDATVAAVERVASQAEPDMHDLLAALSLLDAPDLPADVDARLRTALEPSVRRSVARDAAGFAGYGLQPYAVAPHPDSTGAAWVADALAASLDALVAQQRPDGAWAPGWSWAEGSAEWAEAERAWCGVLTLDALLVLRAHRRLPAIAPP